MVGCGVNYTYCPRIEVSSAGNCVNAKTESVIGHYGEIMSSALRHALAVKTRLSSAEMMALSVAMFGVQLDTTLLLRCHPIATATLSGYVKKNIIIQHTCKQCVLTYVTRHQLAVPCAVCVCL
jgi:hypothetical protein